MRPPRAAFVDFPNGNTTGRVGQPELTRTLLMSAFALLDETETEVLVDLDHEWDADHSWKDRVFNKQAVNDAGETVTVDDRVQRFDTPQYQTDADTAAAAASHDGQDCLVCIGIDY